MSENTLTSMWVISYQCFLCYYWLVKGLEIAPSGITIAHDEDGKNTGDAYVEFASPEIASQAMNKHKEKIGHRLGGLGQARDLYLGF